MQRARLTPRAPARLLFTVICVLFGIMNLGAAVGFLLDARERRAFFAALQHPAVGFRATEEGVWIWKFSLEPLRGEIDAPTGAWRRPCSCMRVSWTPPC
jgi:hypothetical protein